MDFLFFDFFDLPNRVSRSAFPTTKSELKLMHAAAIMGLSSIFAKENTPAATGIAMQL